MKPNRNGSAIAGFILILAGILFLLDNVGISIDIWYYLGRYWPIILILIGLNQIISYSRRR